jgi:hypothetical protein
MKSQTVREIVIGVTGALLGGLIVFVSSPFLLEMWDGLADIILPQLSHTALLSLLAILTTVIVALAILLFRSSSVSWLMKSYQHDSRRGFWVHKKTGKEVCGNCLHHGRISPLTIFWYPNGPRDVPHWTCDYKECGKKYPASDEDAKKA